MEAVFPNSTNSPTNSGHISNPSTARLLIAYMSRLIENDIKSTVEAFELIEKKMDIELGKATKNVNCPKNSLSSNRCSRRDVDENNFYKNDCIPTMRSSFRERLQKPFWDMPFDEESIGKDNFECCSPTREIELRSHEYAQADRSSLPLANSTLISRETSLSSLQNSVPSRVEKAPNGTDSKPCDDNSTNDFQKVAALYPEFQFVVKRVIQRLSEDSFENRQPINEFCTDYYNVESSNYDPVPHSMIGLAHRSSSNGHENRNELNLPPLPAFDERNASILNERFVPKSFSNSPITTDIDNRKPFLFPGAKEEFARVEDCIVTAELDVPDVANENENQREVNAHDVHISDDEVRTWSPTGKTSNNKELTDGISSSLLATPLDSVDLDEIALLISKASPNRRVILKKQVPDVAVKGYHKNCSEKLIFMGDRITHVKTDRKTMCRQIYPQNEIE